MASKVLVGPICASRSHPPRLRFIRPYSQASTKTYENILVELPKPGVGLSMQCFYAYAYAYAVSTWNHQSCPLTYQRPTSHP